MKRKILLADDSPTIQRLVKQTFVDADFEIVSVSNGEAAIKRFEEIQPSVVLADIYMPGRNGYEVCEFVKNHASLSETPVVLLVGAFDAFDEEKARAAGAASNIIKPFEPTSLVQLVNTVLKTVPEQFAREEPVPEERMLEEPVLEEPVLVEPVLEESPLEELAVEEPALVPETDDATPWESDLLGLEAIFVEEGPAAGSHPEMTDDEIDRIVDRVIQRLTTQVIENIAWEVVPDITEKIVREELRRIDES